MVDVNGLLLVVFALALSGAIVTFLVHAAVNAPQGDEDQAGAARFGNWASLSRYEGRRTYYHSTGRDTEMQEW